MHTPTARRARIAVFIIATLPLLAACDGEPPATPGASSTATAPPADSNGDVKRWYDATHVARGAEVYAANCVACHGDRGQGSFNWKQAGANGKLPPPPLDDSAHAWHHPIRALAYQIRNGVPGGQGAMPAFGDKLNDEQLTDVIAYMQEFWSDPIYSKWLTIEMRSRQQQ